MSRVACALAVGCIVFAAAGGCATRTIPGSAALIEANRDFTLGDRDDGEIDVQDDHVRVGRSRYRDRDVVLSALE